MIAVSETFAPARDPLYRVAFFAAHGIYRIVRLVTDNGANYRGGDFTCVARELASRHQKTKPYTPRHDGEAERYQWI